MAGIDFGIAFGNALSSGIKTYGDLQALQMKQQEFAQQQEQWDREKQERQAAQAGAQGTTTAVTPGTIAQSMQGADGKADGDAVMSTYGAMQDPTQAPSVTKNIYAGGVQRGQMANAEAGQGPQGIQYAQRVDVPGSPGGIPAAPQATASGPQGGYNTPTGNGVDQAVQYVRAQEGGYVGNDNGRGPTNYGINGQANGLTPEQIKNLKPEEADQIYKTKYFSGANGGVDISKLPPTAAVAVGDTAANMGQVKAKQLWDQSGGDLTKFLDLRQKAYDSIPGDAATHAVWNNRMTAIREFVNNHGTNEAAAQGDTSHNLPVAPGTKVIQLEAKPLSAGAQGIGDTVQFTHDENGNVQMTKADTAADALQRMATKAFQVGDLKNGPALMNAAIQARSAQAQQQVSAILTNDKLDQDTKVAQLAGMAGAKAFKTEQGNYIIPGLGPVDSRGNPMPMTMAQVGALSSQLASPDGLHHVVQTQLEIQKAADASRATDQKDTELGLKAQEVGLKGQEVASKTALEAADAKLKNKQGDYYEVNADATNAQKNANAAKAQEETQIRQQMAALSDMAKNLNPQDPNYREQMNHIYAQHSLLQSRLSGKLPEPGKGEKLADGDTMRRVDPLTGQVTTTTFNQRSGWEIPADQEPLIRQGFATVDANPKVYAGIIAGRNNGKYGWGIKDTIARNYQLDPNAMYRTPEDALAALNQAKVTRNEAPSGGGIPANTPPAPGQGIVGVNGGEVPMSALY